MKRNLRTAFIATSLVHWRVGIFIADIRPSPTGSRGAGSRGAEPAGPVVDSTGRFIRTGRTATTRCMIRRCVSSS